MSLRSWLKSVIPARLRRYLARSRSDAGRQRALESYAQVRWPSGSVPRIIYALTPPAQLSNVGDQAQVVAIRRWLARHYPDRPVVELDKDMVLHASNDIRRQVTPQDLIFLHSGGNLGDRGLWSETGRRLLIAALPKNRIVSLPQTIYFSDTPKGHEQREISRSVYNAHRHLAVIGRDQVSGALARELFTTATTDVCPDFVLSLDIADFALAPDPADADKILACLRVDDESIFTLEERDNIVETLSAAIQAQVTLFDTTLARAIPPEAREPVLAETLSLFAGHKAVVTDRFHGVIFSVLCRKPTVVLRTVDHKLTSAIDWFADIPNVRFCEHPSQIKDALAAVLATPVPAYPDFNALYFDRLPALVAGMK